jgi:hypothetical protein
MYMFTFRRHDPSRHTFRLQPVVAARTKKQSTNSDDCAQEKQLLADRKTVRIAQRGGLDGKIHFVRNGLDDLL